MPTRSALSIRNAHALVRIGLLPASLIFAACACPGPARPRTDAAPGAAAGITTEMAAATPILSRLYFGTASPDGPVSPADFEAFLDTCVTPRFPLGLTRYAADGQWRGADGKLVKEKSVVVELIHADDAENTARIEAIIVRYKARFRQEAVLRVEAKPSIRF